MGSTGAARQGVSLRNELAVVGGGGEGATNGAVEVGRGGGVGGRGSEGNSSSSWGSWDSRSS
jgi:hypothetical protein